MIEYIGYIGAFLLAVCALPQAFFSLKYGNSDGLSRGFLWSWFLGEIFMLCFTIDAIGFTGPLFYNYAFNTGLLSIIVYFRYFPRR